MSTISDFKDYVADPLKLNFVKKMSDSDYQNKRKLEFYNFIIECNYNELSELLKAKLIHY